MTLHMKIDTDWTAVRMPTGPQRPNLVIVRSGANSLHKIWPKDLQCADRNWDLMLSYYDTTKPPDCPDAEIIVQQGAFKYAACHRLFQDIDWLSKYEFVWFCDDDIMTSWSDVQRMFDIAHEFGLDLAQPSLSTDSYWWHPVTVKQPDLLLHYSNFIEIMMPVFSAHALQICLPSLANIVAGWGLDWVWPQMLGHPRNRVAVIDDVTVRHTRPIAGGTIYKDASKLNIDPGAEMQRILADAKIGTDVCVYGSISKKPQPFNRSQADLPAKFTPRLPIQEVIEQMRALPRPALWQDLPDGWKAAAPWQTPASATPYDIAPLLAEYPCCQASFVLTVDQQSADAEVPVFQIGEQRAQALLAVDLVSGKANDYSLSIKLFNEHVPAFICDTPQLSIGQPVHITLQMLPFAGWLRITLNHSIVLDHMLIATAWRPTQKLWLGSGRLHASISEVRISPFLN